MKIKIVSSCPRHSQDGITHLIGKTYEAKSVCDKREETRPEDRGRMTIFEQEFGGPIIVNPGEYEILH